MPTPYKNLAYFDSLHLSLKSMIQPKSGSNHNSADLLPPRARKTGGRSSLTKSAVIAFFEECSSSSALPSSLPCREAKSVRFGANVDVIEVERFEDDVYGNLWYSEAELLAIEKENLTISWWRRTNDEGLTDDDEKQTIRGLELLVDPGTARRRQETEDLAFESVMVEQDNQDKRDIFDPHAIAEAYQKNGARRCQLEAQAVGLKDFENSVVKMDHNGKIIYKSKALLPKDNHDFGESNYCGYHFDESYNAVQ